MLSPQLCCPRLPRIIGWHSCFATSDSTAKSSGSEDSTTTQTFNSSTATSGSPGEYSGYYGPPIKDIKLTPNLIVNERDGYGMFEIVVVVDQTQFYENADGGDDYYNTWFQDHILRIPYHAVDGTAINGQDFDLPAGYIDITVTPYSHSFGYVEFSVIDDDINESSESFELRLFNTDHYTATAKIIDNDTPVGVSIQSTTINEDEWYGSFQLEAHTFFAQDGPQSLTWQPEILTRDLRVDYTVYEESAQAGLDFALTSGTVIIPAGQSSTELTFDVLDDALNEDTETFRVEITNVSYGFLRNHQATATIIDDESTVRIWAAGARAYEADQFGEIIVEAFYQNNPHKALTFDLTVDLSTTDSNAINGVDYEFTPTTITIPAGSNRVAIPYTVIQDQLNETAELFWSNISSPSFGSIAISDSGQWIYDGTFPVDVQISNVTVHERDISGMSAFLLQADVAPRTDLEISYRAFSRTATQGRDFVLEAGTVIIPAGHTTAEIPFSVINDSLYEHDETFGIVIEPHYGTASHQAYPEHKSSVAIAGATIIDDEMPCGSAHELAALDELRDARQVLAEHEAYLLFELEELSGGDASSDAYVTAILGMWGDVNQVGLGGSEAVVAAWQAVNQEIQQLDSQLLVLSNYDNYHLYCTTSPPPDPHDPGTGDPGTGDPGTGDPGTGDPGTGDPGTGDPGTGDPGTGDPGTGDPGTGDPGTGDPGTGDPGTGDPGTGDPGTGDPGTGDPGTGEPVARNDLAYTAFNQTIQISVLDNDNLPRTEPNSDAGPADVIGLPGGGIMVSDSEWSIVALDGVPVSQIPADREKGAITVDYYGFDVIYTPAATFRTGSDTFTYTVRSAVTQAEVTATVTVHMLSITAIQIERWTDAGPDALNPADDIWETVGSDEVIVDTDRLRWSVASYSHQVPAAVRSSISWNNWQKDHADSFDDNGAWEWQPFIEDFGSPVEGNPGAGEWAIMPAIQLGMNANETITVTMEEPAMPVKVLPTPTADISMTSEIVTAETGRAGHRVIVDDLRQPVRLQVQSTDVSSLEDFKFFVSFDSATVRLYDRQITPGDLHNSGQLIPSGSQLINGSISINDLVNGITVYAEGIAVGVSDIELKATVNDVRIVASDSVTAVVTGTAPLVVYVEFRDNAIDLPIKIPQRHPFALTAEEWTTLLVTNRDNFKQAMGSPRRIDLNAPNHPTLVQRFEQFLTSAETVLATTKNRIARVESMLATPASFTRPQFYQAAADAISAFDLYFFRLIEVSLAYGDVFGEYGATLPQSIDDRFWRLPFHVDGLDIKFTNHQLDEAARALRGIDAGIDANVRHLDNVETGIYVGAAIGAGIAFAPAVVWFAGTSAGAALGGALAEAAPWLLLHGAWNAASNRVADGQGDVDVIEGTLADMTGWTSLNMGVYQIDPVTGQPFALTPGQRAVNIVGGSVQLVLVVAGVTAAGRAVQQEFQIASNQFPPPGGLSVSTPGIGGGLALEGTLGATATGTSGGAIAGTLGATRPLVVYMTSEPAPEARSLWERVQDAIQEKYRFDGRFSPYQSETWELTRLEGPKSMSDNRDPGLGPNQVRYQATVWDDLEEVYREFSVNYDPDTGMFGIIKPAGGR